MICVIADPIDLANYIDVWNLYQNDKSQTICHIKWADLSNVSVGETLYLLGHGDLTTLEGYTATKLAEALVKKGLTDKVFLAEIKLLVCQSGRTLIYEHGVPKFFNKDPYCQSLADALVQEGGPRTVVIGYDGATTVTDDRGHTFAKDKPQSEYPDWGKFTKKHSLTMTSYDMMATKMSFGSAEEILKNAKQLFLATERAFQWLYKNNKLYVKTAYLGETYGIPGQKITHYLYGGKFHKA